MEEEKENEFWKLKPIENIDLDELIEARCEGLHRGKLDNGLSYYVRSHSKPSSTIYDYLAVKAGSALEENNELGIAHMLEHLAFTAVEFKDPDVKNYLETLLTSGGPCKSLGLTGCDFTLYSFPAKNEKELTQAISVLAGISSEVKVCEENLEKERGVVMDEYNKKYVDVHYRQTAAVMSLRYSGTKYEQLTIGKAEIIKGVSAETVNNFYRKWYQLPRMSIVIVGDTDLESMVNLISTFFGSKEPDLGTKEPDLGIPPFREPHISCFIHPSIETGVLVTFGLGQREPKSLRDLKAGWAELVFIRALGIRFERRSNASLDFHCRISDDGPEKVLHSHAECLEGMTVDTLEKILTEINSLEEEGGIPGDVEPLEETVLDPLPGTLMEKVDSPKVGATELLLSNGMRVCYKDTNMGDESVSLQGFAFGGLSEVCENDYVSCSVACEIARLSSICGSNYSVTDGDEVDFEVLITYYQRSFRAFFPSSCIEATLMLLFTTNKEPEEGVLKKVMDHMETIWRESDALGHYVKEVNGGASYHFKAVNHDVLKQVDSLKACRYFNDCFRDPSTFFVVLAGKVDPDIASPLILKYLAGIPKPHMPIFNFPRKNLKAIPFAFPETVVRKEIVKANGGRGCSTVISIPLELNGNLEKHKYLADVLCKLIKVRVFKKLRFIEGQTYRVDLSCYVDEESFSLFGTGNSYMLVSYTSSEDKAWQLVDNVMDEIEKLQDEGPDEDEMSIFDQIHGAQTDQGCETNQWWTTAISESYWSSHYTGDLDSAFEIRRSMVNHHPEPMTADSAKVELRRLLPFPCKERYTVVILRKQG